MQNKAKTAAAITAAERKAAAAKTAKLKAEREAANKPAEKAAKTPAQLKQATLEAKAERREIEQSLPPATDTKAGEQQAIADHNANLEAFTSDIAAIETTPEPATPKADKPKSEFRKASDETLRDAATVYTGLSQIVTNHKKRRPFSVYAESANRPNSGHAPNDLTTRDETATLIGLRLTNGDLSKPFNPGDLSGDKSACGIRAIGHGHFTFTPNRDAFLLTERGKAVAESVLARIVRIKAEREAAAQAATE